MSVSDGHSSPGERALPVDPPPQPPLKETHDSKLEALQSDDNMGIVYRKQGVLVKDRRNARHASSSPSSPTSAPSSTNDSPTLVQPDLIEGDLKVIHVDNSTVMIEWIPLTTVPHPTSSTEGDASPEWTVIEGQAEKRIGKAVLRCSPLQVELSEIKSYRLSDDNNQVVLIQKDGTNHNPLIFLDEGPQHFLEAIAKFQNIRPSQSDRQLFLLTDPRIEALDESLAALNLFDASGDRTDMVSKLINDFHKDPYTTALSAFSKIADRLIQGTSPFDEDGSTGEEMAELLHQSMMVPHLEVKTSHVSDAGEFEVVTETEKFIEHLSEESRAPPIHQMEWELSFDEDGRLLDFDQVRKRVFQGGAEPAVRMDLWKFLLHYYPAELTYAERVELRKTKVEDYYRMKTQWESITVQQEDNFSAFRERKIQIEKDVHRTDRTHSYFEGDNNPNLVVLKNILMTYVMFNFDLGYVQGMSDLLAPILNVMQNEVDAFWCFEGFMRKIGANFALDQGGIREQLDQVGELQKAVDPEFHSYLVSKDSGNYYFCFRWLLIWFKREFPFEDVLRLWEVIWAPVHVHNYHLIVCVAILHRAKSTIMENKFGLTETLKHINDMAYEISLAEVLVKADAILRKLEEQDFGNEALRRVFKGGHEGQDVPDAEEANEVIEG